MATSPNGLREPSSIAILLALSASLAFVAATRLPFARASALDSDELGFLAMIGQADFPMHHTLFLASAKAIGTTVGNPYLGFVTLDMITSALALAATWWLLRAVVPPLTAAGATLALAVSPVFWTYGAMAANYTAIVLVGSTLLGIAARGRAEPKPIHPHAAAVLLALGTGYRLDIGLFWLPVFLAILWRHRWVAALQSLMLFLILDLAWLIPMLRDAGGWEQYRAATADFANTAGYLNSVWNLGWIDAPVRYLVKIALALGWTLGIGLLFVPAGLARLRNRDGGPLLIAMIAIAAIPAFSIHLLVHFGMAGYAFHYAPGLVVLMAVGLAPRMGLNRRRDLAGAGRALIVAGVLAGLFLFYPAEPDRRDFRGQFDLTCARYTRVGLQMALPDNTIDLWRTANSNRRPANAIPASARPRHTLLQLLPGVSPGERP